MTKKVNKKKEALVTEINQKLEKANAFFLTDYKGLTHQQLEDLRKALKKVEADYSIVKNTLFKKSLKDTGNKKTDKLSEFLKDPTAAFFIYGDALKAIKELSLFSKNYTLPQVKIGLINDQVITKDDFLRLSSLPSREVLLSILAARLNSPLTGLHYALTYNLQKFVIALNNIKNKK